MAQEREGYKDPGPNTKGGGFRGGPKRWTGAGPRPARHIPWPEIFKHHISLIEGHLKMTDMVRKHTVEGTGNWRVISDIVDRTKEMLYVAKSTARTFVPPVNHLEQVPLGSSSASMYPGYSPADHVYGKAAEEYGSFVAAAKAQGIDIKHPDIDYEVGQARSFKGKTLEGIREVIAVKHGGPGSRGAGLAPGGPPTKPQTPYTLNSQNQAKKPEESIKETSKEAVTNSDQPCFVIDVNPTPVDIPGITPKASKRSATPPEPIEVQKSKKAKKNHVGDLPGISSSSVVEFEDISQEVDARLKEKEAKRKRKEEKKRKRELGESPVVQAEISVTALAAELEESKKKKSKKGSDDVVANGTASKKRINVEDAEGQGEGKKKKRKKSQKEVDA